MEEGTIPVRSVTMRAEEGNLCRVVATEVDETFNEDLEYTVSLTKVNWIRLDKDL